MKNPCKNCLVKSMCFDTCKDLSNFLNDFINSFDKSTPIGTIVEAWNKIVEERPRILEGFED